MVVQQGQHGSVQHGLAHFCSVNVVYGNLSILPKGNCPSENETMSA